MCACAFWLRGWGCRLLTWLLIMAVQRFELDVDPSFEIHTSYHNDFFLLRTRVLVNGEITEIRSVREGKYEGPVLNFCHSGSTISTKLHLVASTVSPTLVQQFGVYHVDTFYYEQSPLFHVVFSSESCLKNFIFAIEEVKSALEPKLQSLFLKSVLQAESAQQLTVEVQPDLFLVSPNRQETKGAEIHLVTVENCTDFVTRWRDSKLFDFGALYQEEGIVASLFTVAMNLECRGSMGCTLEITQNGLPPILYYLPFLPQCRGNHSLCVLKVTIWHEYL